MINISSLSKNYDDFNLLIEKCDFGPNTLVSIIGNNGSGKSTLLKSVANMTFFNGQILIKKISNKKSSSWKNHISTFLGEDYLLDFLNKEEYLSFFCGAYNKDYKKNLKLFPSLKSLYDSIPTKKLIRDYSKGSRAKLGVISVLLTDTKIMIFDEPYANLDVDSQMMLSSLLKDIKKNKTILITSHNLDLVLDICDRFLVLDHGKLILDAPKREPVDELKKEITGLLHKSKEESNLDWLK